MNKRSSRLPNRTSRVNPGSGTKNAGGDLRSCWTEASFWFSFAGEFSKVFLVQHLSQGIIAFVDQLEKKDKADKHQRVQEKPKQEKNESCHQRSPNTLVTVRGALTLMRSTSCGAGGVAGLPGYISSRRVPRSSTIAVMESEASVRQTA